MAKNLAIVTGANKGIGLATVKSLAKNFPGTVYLTSRNEERGIAAAKSLKNDFHNVKFVLHYYCNPPASTYQHSGN